MYHKSHPTEKNPTKLFKAQLSTLKPYKTPERKNKLLQRTQRNQPNQQFAETFRSSSVFGSKNSSTKSQDWGTSATVKPMNLVVLQGLLNGFLILNKSTLWRFLKIVGRKDLS